jgi:hypothetical protein
MIQDQAIHKNQAVSQTKNRAESQTKSLAKEVTMKWTQESLAPQQVIKSP